MRKKWSLILIFVLFICSINLLSSKLIGTVYDKESKIPLNNVEVKIFENGVGTITDENGKFLLILPDDATISLQFILDSYKTFQINSYSLSQNMDRELKIELSKDQTTTYSTELPKDDSSVTTYWKRKRYTSEKYGKHYDLNNYRLFLSPTARMPEDGLGYISSYELLVLSFGFSVNEKISFSSSMLVPLSSEVFAGGLGLKYSIFDREKSALAAAGGVFFAKADDETAGIFQERLILTLGNIDKSFTFSAGMSQNSEESNITATLTAGFSLRSSKHSSLIFEFNRFMADVDDADDTLNTLTYGFRFFGDRMSGDISFIRPLEDMGSAFPLGFPLVNFTYFFDRKGKSED